MIKTSIHSLVESALRQMETEGASHRKIKSYSYIEFGEFVRYFKQIGKEEYSAAIIDEFVLIMRSKYESGSILIWKWDRIRRGGELLKYYNANNTLNMPRCRPWEALHNPLRRQLTAEELCDSNSIRGLIARTKLEML